MTREESGGRAQQFLEGAHDGLILVLVLAFIVLITGLNILVFYELIHEVIQLVA